MKAFLQIVAEDIFKRFGSNLNNIAIIFPNKRASLFFNEYLISQSDTPIWAPKYLTISELFSSLCDYKTCDSIEAVCRLHKVYSSIVQNPMTLDEFYGWGEKLIKDFDDIDKNLVAPDLLFQNLKAIKEIDKNDFLTKEQREAIHDFFKDFSQDKDSALRKNFIDIWNILLPLYEGFNKDLLNDGLGYEGGIFRSVITHFEDQETQQKLSRFQSYIIVGFNLLSAVERRLLHNLQKDYCALFYWDYDVYFTSEYPHHEAGDYIRQNIKEFGNSLSDNLFNNFKEVHKKAQIVSTMTNSGQTGYASEWLAENVTENARQTAVVLCDENLLLPMLHALPPSIDEINITKGYPLSHTPAFSRIENSFKAIAQDKVTDTDSIKFIEQLKEATKNEALKNEEQMEHKTSREEDILEQLYAESEFQTYQLLSRFERLLQQKILNVSFSTLHNLLRHLMRQTNIPFHGEPAQGLQILGMLETRCLDFDNILLLSVNENTLPPSMYVSSFIPHELRKVFGMTTVENEICIYSYYFYRLLERAKNITFVYNANSDGSSTGEMSRFLMQLLVESNLKIERFAAQSNSQTIHPIPIQEIKKDENIFKLLNPRKDKEYPQFSPSALNKWLTCQIQFYFRYIVGIIEPQPDTDVIPPNLLGSIFHSSAQIFYEEITHNSPHVRKEQLEEYLTNQEIKLLPFIRQAFEKEKTPFQTIIAGVIQRYLGALIKADYNIAPFDLVEMEEDHFLKFDILTPLGKRTIQVGGRIDRIDKVLNPETGQPMLRVVDYKTGGKREYPQSMESLIKPSATRAHYTFQVFLYSLVLCSKVSIPIAPSLFFVNHVFASDFSPYISWGKEKEKKSIFKFQDIQTDFQELLENIINDIFDLNKPFTPTPLKNDCRFCYYKDLCGRNTKEYE